MAKKQPIATEVAAAAWEVWEGVQFYLQKEEIKHLEQLFKKELAIISNSIK